MHTGGSVAPASMASLTPSAEASFCNNEAEGRPSSLESSASSASGEPAGSEELDGPQPRCRARRATAEGGSPSRSHLHDNDNASPADAAQPTSGSRRLLRSSGSHQQGGAASSSEELFSFKMREKVAQAESSHRTTSPTLFLARRPSRSYSEAKAEELDHGSVLTRPSHSFSDEGVLDAGRATPPPARERHSADPTDLPGSPWSYYSRQWLLGVQGGDGRMRLGDRESCCSPSGRQPSSVGALSLPGGSSFTCGLSCSSSGADGRGGSASAALLDAAAAAALAALELERAHLAASIPMPAASGGAAAAAAALRRSSNPITTRIACESDLSTWTRSSSLGTSRSEASAALAAAAGCPRARLGERLARLLPSEGGQEHDLAAEQLRAHALVYARAKGVSVEDACAQLAARRARIGSSSIVRRA